MKANTIERYFEGRRFLNLLRYEFNANLRTLIIILATTVGVCFVVDVASVAAAPYFRIHEIFYPTMVLMIGGLIYSSLAFRAAHEAGNDLRYLTLPCSNLEKTLSQFASTAILYPILSALAYFLMTAIAALLTLSLFGINHALFNPFSETTLKLFGIYLIVQSLFVFGSIYFKKMALAKTLLSVIGLGLSVAIFAGILFVLMHIDLFINGTIWRGYLWDGEIDSDATFFIVETIPVFAFQFLFAPYFWILTYLRLREQEVRTA